MTKAEERANERYPLMQESDIDGLEALKYMGIEFDTVYEFNSARYTQQVYFIEGYQQAEKDIIEKACKWIKENITNNPDATQVISRKGCITLGMLIEEFKKAMKE